VIRVKDICKSYGDLGVLNGVNLTVKSGETVSIVGASGAGKTTLLQIIGTLDKADSGEIEIDNTALHTLNDKHLLLEMSLLVLSFNSIIYCRSSML
jgi:lipoprotein-releasing system ATP-binding protein